MTVPTVKQRAAACQRLADRNPVMFQNWRDLLFIHWELEPEEVQRTLPKGLTVDTYAGKAYLGLVPFFMRDIRPRYCPAVPWISYFLEMNLRTYVYDCQGRPGVWFYSLDANQWLAVRVARTFFNLPYWDASMQASRNGVISYHTHRRGTDPKFDTSLEYAELDELEPPLLESLEYFLIERYILFAQGRDGSLFLGRVHHSPYPLREVRVQIRSEGASALAGFEVSGRPPDHEIMSRGVDVDVFAIERVS